MTTNLQPNMIEKPGDIRVDRVILRSHSGSTVELLPVFEQITIVENMWVGPISGSITLSDTHNLISNFPITGGETLTITFLTPSTEQITKSFRVYGIDKRIVTDQSIQTFRIDFTTPEAIASASTKISKSFEGTYSEIAAEVFDYIKNDESPLISQKTEGKKKLIIPYWSALKTIRWLASKSQAANNPLECNFVFFQNIGAWYFVSLTELMRQEPKTTYSRSRPHIKFNDKVNDINDSMKAIQSMFVSSYANTLHDINNGTFAGTLIDINPTKKTHRHHPYVYREDFYSLDHLNEYPLTPERSTTDSMYPTSRYEIRTSHTNLHDGYEDLDRWKDWYMARQSLIYQLQSHQLEIRIPGNSRRRIGQVVRLEVNSTENSNEIGVKNDPYLTGNYLITGVNHTFTKADHVTTLVLSKDSVEQPYPDIATFNQVPRN